MTGQMDNWKLTIHGRKTEGRILARWRAAVAILAVAALGILGIVVAARERPGFFDEGLVGNLVAEAIGATVIAGLIALLLKAREDRQWKPVEGLMLSHIGHWVARIFMNAALALPPENGQRIVEFVDQDKHVGYRFARDFDFDFNALSEEVATAFARYTIGAKENPYEADEQPLKAGEFYLGTEAELGAGFWDWLHGRLEVDTAFIEKLTSRYDHPLITRHQSLFRRLSELEEVGPLLGDAADVSLLSGGIYAVFFRTAAEVAKELARLGYPCALRTHTIDLASFNAR